MKRDFVPLRKLILKLYTKECKTVGAGIWGIITRTFESHLRNTDPVTFDLLESEICNTNHNSRDVDIAVATLMNQMVLDGSLNYFDIITKATTYSKGEYLIDQVGIDSDLKGSVFKFSISRIIDKVSSNKKIKKETQSCKLLTVTEGIQLQIK